MIETSCAYQIQLFVSSEDPVCEEVATALYAWGDDRTDSCIEMTPVLSQPEKVVRLQIFYTPALVINGKLIAGGIDSAADLTQFLPE
jgi:hypothetical protein